MAAENRLRGAPRIHGELLKLGIAVSERTVSRYLASTRMAPVTNLAYISRQPLPPAGLPRRSCSAARRTRTTESTSVVRSLAPLRHQANDRASAISGRFSIGLCQSNARLLMGGSAQAHVHHRRGEHPGSRKDPPKPQAVAFDLNAHRRRLHSSGACMRASVLVKSPGHCLARTLDASGASSPSLRPITSSASSEGCNVLRF